MHVSTLEARKIQRESPSWSRTLIVIAITFTVLATIFFALRLYSRKKTSWKPAIDDVFLGIGLLFSYLLSACVFWLGQKFWCLAHVFVKLSIIFLIRRILFIVGSWQKITTGLIVFTVAWGVTNIVGNALQCFPPRYFWLRTIDGRCPDDQEAFAIVMGSLALAEDVVLLVIPISVVWRMMLVRSEKIRITILFGFGGLYVLLISVRVVKPHY
ncbi:hypothetical protein N7474_007836 [Penicillium riverlandense]|uniref:uncharacterized protein n=1 Tax=Penicillium riverlandense TaxID=1903569 RepID=UPI002548E94F|nr:uncharacterized protein N7474_007836 [Penicillium riverlandense]KAJ5811535.1 hypothetical protein N7474_007836 [Penicillium riverlandense]